MDTHLCPFHKSKTVILSPLFYFAFHGFVFSCTYIAPLSSFYSDISQHYFFWWKLENT